MSTLIDIYKSLLRFSGLEADEHGYISAVMNDRKEPTNVGGVRLVLPTHEQLRHFNPNEKVIFHPLAENILKTESEVIKKFRDIINIRLNYTIGVVVQSLLNLIASPDLHKRLSPEQMELLLAIKDADEKTVLNFIQHMVSVMKSKPDRIFVNIFLKKGGWKGKDKFSRLAVVSFPFYESLSELKVRKKDQETYRQIFEYLFMDIDKKEEYNYGSNSRVAPYLDALMNSAVGIASRLNDTIQLFGDFIDEADKLVFDSDWYEYFQNLEELLAEIRKVPAHVSQDNNVEPAQTLDIFGQQQQPVYPNQQQPTQYPVQNQFVPGYTQQVNYTPVQQVPAGVVQTERGLDFKSMMANNPVIAAAPNPLLPHLLNQQAMQYQQFLQQQPPTWANQQPVQYPQQPVQYVQQPVQYTQPVQYPQQQWPQQQWPQRPM